MVTDIDGKKNNFEKVTEKKKIKLYGDNALIYLISIFK